MRTVNIGLIGFGTVGGGVWAVLQEKAAALASAGGLRLQVARVCDCDSRRPVQAGVPAALFSTDASTVLEDEAIDIVVELIGGIEPAKEYILTALRRKKHVVTANKALLAEHGDEIFRVAQEQNVEVFFEASVGGGIPIILALRQGLVANAIDSVYGIVNGTCNYILSRMSGDAGVDFAAALSQAQHCGYAEQDPAFDIDGIDAAHKICILSRLCFQARVSPQQILVEGIRAVARQDTRYAADLGFTIKLLAIAKRRQQDALDVRVHPTLVPRDHLLAHVNGVYNALFIRGDYVGEQLFYGQGAGRQATASAVVSDIVQAGQRCRRAAAPDVTAATVAEVPAAVSLICPATLETPYYIRFSAEDRPGVLSQIANILAGEQISIRSVMQQAIPDSNGVPLVMMTHSAQNRHIDAALAAIAALPSIRTQPVAIRVETL